MDAEKQALKALMKMINEKYAGQIETMPMEEHLGEDREDLEEMKSEAEAQEDIAEKMMERDDEEMSSLDMEKLREFLSGAKPQGPTKSKQVFGMTRKMIGKKK
jgi:hypothetical protein